MSRLRNGQPFPPLEVPAVGGGTISLPGDLAGSYGVVLIYRGSWCPYCNAQLAAFSRAAGALTGLGVKLAALSVDDERPPPRSPPSTSCASPSGTARTPATSPRRPARTSTRTRATLQPAGFVLAADGTVRAAVYSSDAIGRLAADDVAGYLRYLTEHAA
jgi:hypothetical protein